MECPISDTVYFIYNEADAGDYIDLACEPSVSVWRLDDGSQKNVPAGREPVEKVVDAHDDMYNGLIVQPPENGMTRTTYLLSLPEEPANFYAMLLEVSGAGDAVFTLSVNDDVLAEWTQAANAEWQEVELSLAEYAGKTVLLTMSVDGTADGVMGFWGDPFLETE